MIAQRRTGWQRALAAAAGITAALVCLAAFAGFRYGKASRALQEAEKNLADVQNASPPAVVPAPLLQAARAAIPTTPEIPQWLQSFRQTTQNAGLKWISVRQAEGATEGAAAKGRSGQGPEQVVFEATLQGDYLQVTDFLARVAAWPRLVDPVQWKITRTAVNGAATGNVTATLTLVSYYLPGQPPGQPEPVQSYVPSGKLDPTR